MVMVPRMDRLLANNLLANRPNRPPDVSLPAADLEVEAPEVGTLSFECASRAFFDRVAMYLQGGGVPLGPDGPAGWQSRVRRCYRCN
jgi:hypothetical protein